MKKYLLNIILLLVLVLSSCAKNEDTQKAPDDSKNTGIDNPFDPDNPSECLAIDTDGDGILDCEDPDIDGDGVLNELDAFPYDKYEWLDSDGDGIGDNSDWAPLDPTEWADTDGDTIGNNADEDDDNDGVPDIWDHITFRLDKTEWFDIDNDGIGNNADEDDDNDGVPDIWDHIRWASNGWFDIDNDLIHNSFDDDMDGDGVPNLQDAFPYDKTEWVDTDGDGIGNNIDPDDDNDGFPDSWEDFPLNRLYLFDTDGDGVPNEEDAFPYDKTEWVDTDGDGVGDNSDPFPLNPQESADTDGDGIGDNSDPDVDNDGFPNCIPYHTPTLDPTYPACDKDKFPKDSMEWLDTDGDGIGDNSDEDDDNDGVPDIWDDYPLDYHYFKDNDKDKIPDLYLPASEAEKIFLGVPAGSSYFILDSDIDNDGVPNIWDDLPTDPYEYFDIDNDKIGSRKDTDWDGDGVLNHLDKFPWDPTEWADNDNDGIGDNADEDDDNDGVPDIWDDLPFNALGFVDSNKDNIPDNISNDGDGDGYSNGTYSCVIRSPVWRENFLDINNDGVLDSVCSANNIIIPTWYSGVPEDDNPTLNNCLLSAQTYIEQQNCFNHLDLNDIEYKSCITSSTPLTTCELNYNIVKNRCSSYSFRECAFEAYSNDGTTGRNDLYPFDKNEWKDNDNDGLPDNQYDEDDDNDGVPDIWDLYPDDKTSDKKWRWFDSDNDGLPNFVYYYDQNDNTYKYEYGNAGLSGIIADNDSDNDGVDQGKLICTRVSDNRVVGPNHYALNENDFPIDNGCDLGELYNEDTLSCEQNPNFQKVHIINGSIDVINCFYEKGEGLDSFPFNSSEWSDFDLDRIGDNKDKDIDNDRKNNCSISDDAQKFNNRYHVTKGYLAGSNSALSSITSFISKKIGNNVYRFEKFNCDEDDLPFVSNQDLFFTKYYQPLDTPLGYGLVPYCANQADCYFKNYDSDNDGLTDYEEFILGTNPHKADTDGDGVSDLHEFMDGTDPNDSNSFLDDNKNGIPNSLDPFPQGANSQESLIDQIIKTSSCRNRSEISCVSSVVSENYCEIVDDETLLVSDGQGGFDYAKKCAPLPVIITKDILLNDCVSLTGEVIISSINGSKIIAKDFNNATRCLANPEERSLINSLENSDLTLRNVTIEASNIATVIKSTGKSLFLDKTAINTNDNDFITVVDYFNSDGLLKITNSTLRTVMTSSSRPQKTVQESILKSTSKVMTIASSLIDCNYTDKAQLEVSIGSGNYFLDDFNCVNTKSSETMFTKNIISYSGYNNDSSAMINNSKAMNHESIINTVFTDINNIVSGVEGLFIYGNGVSISNTDTYIKDRINRVNGSNPIGVYSMNSSNIQVKESSVDYSTLFSSENESVLFCKNESSTILPTYFSMQSTLTLPLTVESFTLNSVDKLLGRGIFNNLSILQTYWNEENPYFLNTDGYDSTNQRIKINAGAGQPEGLSYKLQGLVQGKKYKILIGLNAVSTAKTNINLNMFLTNPLNDDILENVSIIKEDSPTQARIEYDQLFNKFKYRTDFINDEITFVFKAPQPDVYLRLFNGYPSEHVYVDRIQVVESTSYNTNIIGAPLPVCKEDESHLYLRK